MNEEAILPDELQRRLDDGAFEAELGSNDRAATSD